MISTGRRVLKNWSWDDVYSGDLSQIDVLEGDTIKFNGVLLRATGLDQIATVTEQSICDYCYFQQPMIYTIGCCIAPKCRRDLREDKTNIVFRELK